MDEEAERDLADKLPNMKKQIEAYVLDRTKEALGSSRVMHSFWRENLQLQSELFASEMKDLDASATINHAKLYALGAINDAFCMGVLIGRSVQDKEVTNILAAAHLVRADNARRSLKPRDDYAEARLTEAVTRAMNQNKSPAHVSDAYARLIEDTVRAELQKSDPPVQRPKGWPSISTIKGKVRQVAARRKGQDCQC